MTLSPMLFILGGIFLSLLGLDPFEPFAHLLRL
jgi:hypothetical protein